MNRPFLWNNPTARAQTLHRWAPVLVATALILALGLGGDPIREWGRFEREALGDGELWRLITAHLVHLGWGHLWLNLIALLLMAALFDDAMPAGDWILGGALGAGAIDLGLSLFHAEIEWYVGLSGVLHGLMVVGAVGLLRSAAPIGYLLLAGVLCKLLWEQFAGPLPFSESTSGGPVVVEAHLYGALGGAATLAAKWLFSHRQRSL